MKAICLQCKQTISQEVNLYSIKHFGVPLCRDHQNWVITKKTTKETIVLYYKLLELELPVKLQKFDKHKTIDIAIPKYKLNIEVDGSHHNRDSRQAFSDLQRDYYSFTKGYLTLRIANSLIRDKLNQTIDFILKYIEKRKLTKAA